MKARKMATTEPLNCRPDIKLQKKGTTLPETEYLHCWAGPPSNSEGLQEHTKQLPTYLSFSATWPACPCVFLHGKITGLVMLPARLSQCVDHIIQNLPPSS
jgi:hypothetical protein